jgi:hypothetical protein
MQEYAYFVLWLAFVGMLVWLVFGLPLWIVLGCLSLYENRRSRMSGALATGGDDTGVLRVSRFARPSMVLALSIIGVICLWAGLSIGPWGWFAGEPIMGLLFVVMVVLEVALPVLLLLLAASFTVTLGEMRAKHRMAGRDTAVAYGVIITLQAVALGAAFAFGFFGQSWSLL